MVRKQENSKVYLDPVPHVYIHRETGRKYRSVTTILGMIIPEFDEIAVSASIANMEDHRKDERYVGMNQTEILDYWQYLNDTANEYGTFVHETIEEYLFKQMYWFPEDPFQKKIIKAFDSLDLDEGMNMWPERIMFSEEYELAGMSDLVTDIDEVFFDITDWKGLPVDTPIFTDSGWKTMGTISKNDKVYDMNGKLTKILHLSSVKNKPCYRITFDNNETIVADFEHRWLVSFMRNKKFKDAVMTTEELYDYVTELNSSDKKWSHKIAKIKIAKPLDNPEIDLPIDPYVLGIWLGDGHSQDNKITNMSHSVWSEIENRGYSLGEDVSQGGCGKAQTRTIFGLRSKLNGLSLLNNKHLPSVYLMASYEQRLDLLRGFMDSDGYYNETRKRFVMSTTEEWQVEAFVQLVSSLGIKSTVLPISKRFNGKEIQSYDICFTTNGVNPFMCRNEDVKFPNRNHNTFKNVIKVEKVDSIPTRCIEVESDTHTFLYGHTFSVTHNTNKRFDYHNRYGHETLLPPFDHLQACHYNEYSLQLSIYALMYEMETGRKCRKIQIGYWSQETETMSLVPVMYMKNEAKKLMELHKYRNQLAA